MKNKKSKKSLLSKILFVATLFSFLLKLAKILLGKKRFEIINKNLRKFEKDEINELIEFVKGEETKEKYWHDSLGIFQEYFIPNHKNNHKPRILRTKSLVTIAFLLMFLKVMILSYVFLISPFEAWMSEVITTKVVEFINEERTQENVQLLTLNSTLSASALAKANDMIEKGYFAHFTPDGKKPWDFIDRSQYPYIFVGENLAMNFSSADSVHQALMNSPTHKKNIMNSKYSEVGIAMVSGEIDGKKTNVLVQMFASKSQVNSSLAIENSLKTETIQVSKETVMEETKPLVQSKVVTKKEEVLTSPKEQKIEKLTTVAGLNEQYTSEKQKNQIPELIEEFSHYKDSEKIIPNPNNSLSDKEIIKMPNSDLPRITFISSITKSLNGIFVGALIITIMALILNVLVRIKIQHKPVIVQTFFLLLLIAGLGYWQINLESLDLVEIFIL